MRRLGVKHGFGKKSENISAEPGSEALGKRLRALRRHRGLTITQLAALSDVPSSTISKIERGVLGPSLVNAICLAHALDENLGFLAGKYRSPPERLVVVNSHQRETISFDELRLSLQDLSGRFAAGLLEARIGILAPGATSGTEPMTHEGEEFCYVLKGSIRYLIDGKEIMLEAGEYLQCKAETAHSWLNTEDGSTHVLWVFSDGLSF